MYLILPYNILPAGANTFVNMLSLISIFVNYKPRKPNGCSISLKHKKPPFFYPYTLSHLMPIILKFNLVQKFSKKIAPPFPNSSS